MPKEQREFEVEVEQDETEVEIAPAENTTYDVLDKKEEQKEDAKVIKDGDTEVEVVDDKPEHDRGRKPAKEPIAEVTDDELKNYSANVQHRMKELNKKFHDQRRAAEQHAREKAEIENYARKLMEDNQRLQQGSTRSRNSFIEQAKKSAAAEVAAAERESTDAYRDGDPALIAAANRKLTEAVTKQQRIAAMRPAPLQKPQGGVKVGEDVATTQQPPQNQPQQPQVDERAQKWAEDNSWFGNDEEMTSFALGYHAKLVNKEGIDPRSDEYYEKLNKRVREVFPQEFDYSPPGSNSRSKEDEPASVVAPVRRSAAPKRVRLTETQVAIAKRLGVPLEQYAQEAAKAELQERR